jgi:hypothetical protein
MPTGTMTVTDTNSAIEDGEITIGATDIVPAVTRDVTGGTIIKVTSPTNHGTSTIPHRVPDTDTDVPHHLLPLRVRITIVRVIMHPLRLPLPHISAIW